MHEALAPVAGRWVPGCDLDQTGLRVFCFSYAGGGTATFGAVRAATLPGMEICPVLLPGRESRMAEDLPTDLAVLASDIATELLPLLGVRFAMVGHSAGATLAYEVARSIEDRYRLPAEVFVAACARAPDRTWAGRASLGQLDDTTFLTELAERTGSEQIALLQREPELRSVFLPILRADIAMAETYRPASVQPLTCPVIAVGGDSDPGISAADLDGWRRFGGQGFHQAVWPGGHFCVFEEPHRLVRLIGDSGGLAGEADANRALRADREGDE
jgi:medium-chain acyl-[acyl-carrier-protein] hydrolase